MNRENSGLLIAFVIMVALPLASLAGLRATEKLEGHQITIAGKTSNYPTHEECVDAAKAAGVGVYKCKASTAITVEATCDDEPMPQVKTVLNAEGFMEQPGIVIAALPDGSWGPTMQEGFVKGPGYPNCWVPGLVPYTGEFPAPETPPTADVGPWVYGEPEWPIGGKCPSEDPNMCYVPPHPDVPPA